jgi:putative endonuclease
VVVHGLPSRRVREPRSQLHSPGHARRCREQPTRTLAPQPAPDPRRTLGRLGEDLAADHLRKRGFEILDRNVRTRSGEIDLIVTDGALLVFVEVKCRRRSAPSSRGPIDTARALEAIGPAKQARLRRLAAQWLSSSVRGRPFAGELRFDAIAIAVDREGRLLRLDHLEGAW